MTPDPEPEGTCDLCGAEGDVFPGLWMFIRKTVALNLCELCVKRLEPREGDVVRLADVG